MTHRLSLMLRWTLAGTAALALLTGCGGGGGGNTAAADPLAAVPDTASQSSDGLTAYLQALVPRQDEGAEPLSLSGVSPPTSDNTEPTPVS